MTLSPLVSSRVVALDNVVQHYDWGSHTVLQDLLGVPDERPDAELWLGAHRSAPSRVLAGPGGVEPTAPDLASLVLADPAATLGRRVQDAYGPRLPYLLKVLAAERALSLQVHPLPHQARAGFNRENAAGVPATAPERSFHDDQHKPEMIVAITPFRGLAGFRRPAQAQTMLDGVGGEIAARMRFALGRGQAAAAVQEAFEVALAARDHPGAAADVARALQDVRARQVGGVVGPRATADQVALRLADEYPGDPGALASYLLNVFELEPGQAVFLAPGQVHAYLWGAGVEIMASSDNVLRAGLTHKHVDVEALVECASFAPTAPQRPVVRTIGGHLRTYRVAVPEFGLVMGQVAPQDGAVALPHEGPRIALCLEGSLTLAPGRGGDVTLTRGESVFVPDAAGDLAVRGAGALALAYVP